MNPSPQFAGAGAGLLPKALSVLDGNQYAQLVAADLMGMVGPRTLLAFLMRGKADGQEVAIREFSGFYSLSFMLAHTSWLATRMIRNSRLVNPYGLDLSRWINANSMHVLANMFEDALKDGGSPQDIRRNFYTRFAASLQAADPQNTQTINRLLPEAAKRFQTDARLDGTGVSQLVDQLMAGATGEEASKLGQELKGLRRFLFAHLSEGQKTDKALTHKAHAVAVEHGLSSSVNMTYQPTRAGAGLLHREEASLAHLLSEAFRFDDVHLSRAFTGLSATEPLSEAAGRLVHDRLFLRSAGGFVRKFIPRVGDGSLIHAMVAKTWQTKVALAVTSIAAMSVAFVNILITKHENGGKVFFPGDMVGAQPTLTKGKSSLPIIRAKPTETRPLDPSFHKPTAFQLFDLKKASARQPEGVPAS
ncbi:MAG: hypothetical protein AB7P76_01190 [Candidatus Melainabacteria bacterium]